MTTTLLERPARTAGDAATVATPAATTTPAPATTAPSPELAYLRSRHSDGPATVEELVARDIEAFSARRVLRARLADAS